MTSDLVTQADNIINFNFKPLFFSLIYIHTMLLIVLFLVNKNHVLNNVYRVDTIIIHLNLRGL